MRKEKTYLATVKKCELITKYQITANKLLTAVLALESRYKCEVLEITTYSPLLDVGEFLVYIYGLGECRAFPIRNDGTIKYFDRNKEEWIECEPFMYEMVNNSREL